MSGFMFVLDTGKQRRK